MNKVLIILLLLVLPVVACFAEIQELALGTGGNRAFISLSHEKQLHNPLQIDENITKIDLTPILLYYFDHQRKETKETIESIEKQQNFLPTEGRSGWGHVDAACWFKFDFVADISSPVDLNMEVLITGFPITIEPGQKGSIYFRLDYPAGILSNAFLYDAQHYITHQERRVALNAIVLGINIAMILYNMFLFIWTKKKEFLYFIAYMLCFSFHIYLREDYINSIFPFLRDYFFGLPAITFAILFAMEFLKTKQIIPVMHRALQGMFGISIFYSIVVIFFRSRFVLIQKTQSYFQIAVIFLAIVVSIILITKRHWVGLFYIISWLPLIASNFALQFEQLGIFQTNTPLSLFIVREGFYLSAAFQALLLSITLANQINLFRREAETEKIEKKHYKDLDKLKTEFIMNVSHEFRTPLTIINGTTNNIISGSYGEKIDKKDPIFHILRRNGSRLLILINNLLNISKLELKKQDVRFEPINIVSFIQLLLAEFESLALRKGISIVFNNTVSKSTNIEADTELLEIILLNLLSNAIKFTGENGTIDVSLAELEKKVEIKISDTGPGIEENELEKIFEKFYQTENDGYRKHEGAGIGLALVKECIELLHNNITVQNRSPKGLEFSFKLDCSQEHSTAKSEIDLPQTTLVRNSLEATPIRQLKNLSGKAAKILLVEDNRDLQEYISSELYDTYSVHITSNGKEALEYLSKNESPNLILSDIMMPEMNGIELYKAIKKEKSFDHVPFLFISARAMGEEKESLLQAGAMDYIYKPFSAAELKAKINSIILQDAKLKLQYKEAIKTKIIEVLEDESPIASGTTKTPTIEHFCEIHDLTKREKEVLGYIVQGLKDKEIAEELNLAVSTVSNMISRIYKKSGTTRRVELIQSLHSSKDGLKQQF